MKIYVYCDASGNIHSLVRVKDPSEFTAMLAPKPGLFLVEIDPAELDIKTGSLDGTALLEITRRYKVTTPLPRHTLTKKA